MSPRFIRCTAGHVFDASASKRCPQCEALLALQKTSDDLFESVSENDSVELQPQPIPSEKTQAHGNAWRKSALITIAILMVLGVAIYCAKSNWSSKTMAENSQMSLEDSSQPSKDHGSINPGKETAEAEEAPMTSDSSSKAADTALNAKSMVAESDAAASTKTEPDSDKADQFKEPEKDASKKASKVASQDNASKDLSSINDLMSELFPATIQAITELRRVRLAPIPSEFKGWAKKAPQTPLPSSVSRSHSPEAYEFLEQNAVAKSVHWFTQGAVALDPEVRVGCWEYAAFLGHPYAAWALCSHYQGTDPERVQAWIQLAVERGVPHMRTRLASGAEYYGDLNKVLDQVAKLDVQTDRQEAIEKLVAMISKTCDLRIVGRLYKLEVLSQLNQNATTSRPAEFNQAVQQLHRMMLEEFEVRGALPPYFGFDESDHRLSSDIRTEAFIEGIWGLLVPLHRVAVGSLTPAEAKSVYEQQASRIPADQASRFRKTLGHIEKGLFAGLASLVIDQVPDISDESFESIKWRKAQAPFDAWSEKQGMHGGLKDLREQFEISRPAFGLCQYLMARAAEKRKKYDEASGLYEASFINGMLLVSLDYGRMLKGMSAESGMDQDLFRVAESWDAVALQFQVLGANFNRLLVSLNDKKVSNKELRLILNDCVRRGESQGDAFLKVLVSPDGEEIVKNLGLTREELNKFDEPTKQLVWRMQTKLPSSSNSAGLESRNKDVQLLVERAIDQDSWALLALGQRALPDPQFVTDMREELILLYGALRRGNLSAMASAGRQAMFAEDRLQLSPAEKCIFSFAAWVLADKYSADHELIQSYDSLFRETMSRMDEKTKEKLLNWMSDIALAFDKKL